jgi:hypothetical protein
VSSDPEKESEILLNNILIAEDLQHESSIPTKAKQGLIVKKVQNMLNKNPMAIVMRAMLTKQGDKPNRNVEERLVILSSKDIKWYHNEEEMSKGKRPLGVIILSAVYHCVPANTKMSTVDINVRDGKIKGSLAFRLELALGRRKTRAKKEGESLFSGLKTCQREMNGSQALNFSGQKLSTMDL